MSNTVTAATKKLADENRLIYIAFMDDKYRMELMAVYHEATL